MSTRAREGGGGGVEKENVTHYLDLISSGGCVAVSVLTEPHWFKGTIEDLQAVSRALGKRNNHSLCVRPRVDSSCSSYIKVWIYGKYMLFAGGVEESIRPAVLLKDFVLDEWQLLEVGQEKPYFILLDLYLRSTTFVVLDKELKR